MNQPTGLTIAKALWRIADAIEAAPPAYPGSATFNLQVCGYGDTTEPERHAQLDAIARILFGVPGAPALMSSGSWQYRIESHVGPVAVTLYTASERPPDERDAELARLRAELAEVERVRSLREVAAEVPADLAPIEDDRIPATSDGLAAWSTADVMGDPDLYRGDAEKTFDVEQAAAERREYRREEEADLAAERAEALGQPDPGEYTAYPATLDPDTPLDALPPGFGDAHNPAGCGCEDCAPVETLEQSAAIVDVNLRRMGITLGGES